MRPISKRLRWVSRPVPCVHTSVQTSAQHRRGCPVRPDLYGRMCARLHSLSTLCLYLTGVDSVDNQDSPSAAMAGGVQTFAKASDGVDGGAVTASVIQFVPVVQVVQALRAGPPQLSASRVIRLAICVQFGVPGLVPDGCEGSA